MRRTIMRDAFERAFLLKQLSIRRRHDGKVNVWKRNQIIRVCDSKYEARQYVYESQKA